MQNGSMQIAGEDFRSWSYSAPNMAALDLLGAIR